MKTKTILLLLLGLSLVSCNTMKKMTAKVGDITGDQTMSMAKSDLSPEQSQQIGRDMSASLLKRYPRVEDPAVNDYINRLGQYVALHIDQSSKNVKCVSGHEKLLPFKGFRFTVIKSDLDIGVSVPGGFVYVSTGMIGKLKNEDQLAGVLAHEVTHIACQDGLGEVENVALKRGLGKLVSTSATVAGSDSDNEFLSAAEPAGDLVEAAYENFFQNPFSRAQEKVADRGAILALFKSGYYPLEFMKYMAASRESQSSRHPATGERLNAMKADFKKMQTKVQSSKASIPKRMARFNEFLRAVQAAR